MKLIHKFIIVVFLLINAISIFGQSNLSITLDCDTDCFDALVTGGEAPFTIEWQMLQNNNYVILQGYPLELQTLNTGEEDLCGSPPGNYRLIITDSYCRKIAETSDLEECEIIDINSITPPNPKNDKEETTLLNHEGWTPGTGSIGEYKQRGTNDENHRIIDNDPWGKSTTVWEARPDAISNADGGWDSKKFEIDNTKLYRTSVWVNRKTLGKDGKFYLGSRGYGDKNGLKSIRSGTITNNPYFWVSDSNPNKSFNEDEWVLVVGHIYPNDYRGNANHNDSGRYSVLKGKIGEINNDFKWLEGTRTSVHRSYLYYTTDEKVKQQWAYPRFDIVDGTEPSIDELLRGYENYIRDNTASVSVEVIDGEAPYSISVYKKSDGRQTDGKNSEIIKEVVVTGDGTEFNNFILSNIEAGETVCYDITDANCCTTNNCIEVPCVFEPQIIVKNDNCAFSSPLGGLGRIEIVTQISPPPYDIKWSDGSSGISLNNLSPGVYGVTLVDREGCYYVDDEIIIEHENDVEVSAETSPSSRCKPTGSIELIGNLENYKIHWENGSNRLGISGLDAGTHCVTMTDENGCVNIECFEVEREPEMTYTIEATSLACVVGGGGGATISVSGGSPPYTYRWDNDETYPKPSDLHPGVNTVLITDSNGCRISAQVNIETHPEMEIEASMTETCAGGSEGIISVSVNGGSGDYTYEWSNDGGNQSAIFGLSAGTYSVIVTDIVNSCTLNQEFEVANHPEIEINTLLTHNTEGCSNNSGSVEFVISEGAPPYSISMQGVGDVGDTVENLETGDYTFWINDLCGTEQVVVTIIEEPNSSPFILESTIQNPCYESGEGNATGGIHAFVAGPSNLYSYIWSNGVNTSQNLGLFPGSYTVTVTQNSTGCLQIHSYELLLSINEAEITATPSCTTSGIGTGSININTLDTEVFRIEWSNGHQDTEEINNLLPGLYSVTVVDINGCPREYGAIVEHAPSDFEIIVNSTDVCGVGTNGSINLEVQVPGDYSYEWSSGESTQDLENIEAGEYTVTVSDGTGCQERTVTVNSDPEPFQYEFEIVRPFGAEGDGSAIVYIHSNVFTNEWSLEVPDLDDVISFVNFTDNIGYIEIPLTYYDPNVDVQEFDFIASHQLGNNAVGCVYTGSFIIEACENQAIDFFNFEVELVEPSSSLCQNGQYLSYRITPISFGPNLPYKIKAKMEFGTAYDPNESGFNEEFSYNGEEELIIEGIPGGRIIFTSHSNCQSGTLDQVVTDYNCCQGISCDILDEYSTDGFIHDESYIYEFDYFQLIVGEVCFDDTNTPTDNIHSKIYIRPRSGSTNKCWSGVITIGYPDNSNSQIVIEDGAVVDYEFEFTDWAPSSPGAYPITISYEGEAGGNPNGCSTIIEVEWFGDGHYLDAIGFQNGIWWSGYNGPSIFDDAYHAAYVCENCNPDEEYIFSQGECEDFDNWTHQWFTYEPEDYDNPCDAPGVLRLIDFDEEGNAVRTTIDIIEMDLAIDERPGEQPFFIAGTNTWCLQSGWCLFESIDIYGVEFEHPILASWADPDSCREYVFDGPIVQNPEPDCGDNPLDCPFGFECVLGNCVELCNDDGDCISGVCSEDGYCIQSDSDCQPTCPDGWECILGECEKNISCTDNCGCPAGMACNLQTNLCEPVSDECNENDGDCQCQSGFNCVQGQCVEDPECMHNSNCPEGNICIDQVCEACPTISVEACYGQSSCGAVTGCQGRIIIRSSADFRADNITILLNGLIMLANDSNVELLASTPKEYSFSLLDYADCIGRSIKTIVVEENCKAVQVEIPDFKCAPSGHSGCRPSPVTQSGNYQNDQEYSVEHFENEESGSVRYESVISNTTTSTNVESMKLISPEITIYPNPFNNKIEMVLGDIEERFDGELAIMDNLGRIVRDESLNILKGENRFTLDNLESLVPGVYIVVLKKDGRIYATKNMVRME